MPRHIDYYTPDQLDCNEIVTSLAMNWSVAPDIQTIYTRDQVIVVVRCRKVGSVEKDVVQVQAQVRAPLKTAKSLYAMQYSALLDCWHQLDRGLLGVAQTPIEYSWNGRPRTPRRSNAQ